MKLTIERGALLRSLQHAQGVIERRTTIPILSNVLLNADGATLSLTATDMDIAIVERVPCAVAQPGRDDGARANPVRRGPQAAGRRRAGDRQRRRAEPADGALRPVADIARHPAERGFPR